MSRKKDIGKGLRALLSNIENTSQTPTEKKEIVKELASNILEISLESIEVNPFQPRTEFDNDELMELAKSIKIHGLIQPLTVRSLGNDTYQLISGERRMRASKMAGLKEVPAYVRLANDQEMLEMALIENIQRSDLNAIEIAISYQRLMDECSLTHESLSERVGKNRSTVTNYVRLLKLPHEIQQSIKSQEISMGHARALAGITDLSQMLQLYKRVKDQGLSVREVESFLRAEQQSAKAPKKVETSRIDDTDSAEIDRIKKELSKLLGTKVEIKRDGSGVGHLLIKFSSDKEFNSIYDLLRELE